MNGLINLIHQVPWTLVFAALGGGSAVAVVAQLSKKVFKLESEKVIQFLVMSLAFVASGLQYLLGAHNLPPSILGLHTAALLGVAQPLYLYFVKPADKFMTDVKNYKASQTTTSTGSTTSTVTEVTPTITATTETPAAPTTPTTANF